MIPIGLIMMISFQRFVSDADITHDHRSFVWVYDYQKNTVFFSIVQN